MQHNTTPIYGGLPEEHDLRTMHNHAELMRKKYAKYQRYTTHNAQLMVNGPAPPSRIVMDSEYSILGPRASVKIDIDSISINLPTDKLPLDISTFTDTYPFHNTINSKDNVYLAGQNEQPESVKLNDPLNNPMDRFRGFRFTKKLLELTPSTKWCAKGASIISNTDWRTCSTGICIYEPLSGVMVAIVLGNSAIHAVYARVLTATNNGGRSPPQFISIARICKYCPGEVYDLQIDWQLNQVLCTVNSQYTVIVDAIGLIPCTPYTSKVGDIVERRCYNIAFSTYRQTDGTKRRAIADEGDNLEISTDLISASSLQFGIGAIILADLPDMEKPGAEVSNTVPLNFNCNLLCNTLTLSGVSSKCISENWILSDLLTVTKDDPKAPRDWNHYFSLEEIYNLLDHLIQKFPDRCSHIPLGATPSAYGRYANISIRAVHVGCTGADKAHIFIAGGVHARERASINPSLAYLYWLVSSNSHRAIELRSTTSMVYLPVVDPASYARDDAWTVWDPDLGEYVNVPGHLLRKNSNSSGQFPSSQNVNESGVDIDRNFGAVRDVNDNLEYGRHFYTPTEWLRNNHLSLNGTWGLCGSSRDPLSAVYCGEPRRTWYCPINGIGGGSEIETRAVQRLCQQYPFNMALVHMGVGYRLTHAQFPNKDKHIGEAQYWLVGMEDRSTYTNVCRQIVLGTRYTPSAPHIPGSGTIIDWIYASGKVRKHRLSPLLGTIALACETGNSFYPSFSEMGDAVSNGLLLNYASHAILNQF